MQPFVDPPHIFQISICRNFVGELRHIVENSTLIKNKNIKVNIHPYQIDCGNRAKANVFLTSCLKEDADVRVLLGGRCITHADQELLSQFLVVSEPICYSFLLNEEILTAKIDEQKFLITSGSLIYWEDVVKDSGFSRPDYRTFFKENNKGFFFIDSGFGESENKAHLLASEMALPLEKIFSGVSVFRHRIETTLENELYKRQLALQYKKGGDLFMMFDLMSELVSLLSVEEIKNKICSYFQMLFAAELVKIEEGPQEIEKNNSSFQFSIALSKKKTLTCLVSNIAFPRFLTQYHNLSLAVSPVLALAIQNGENYESLAEQQRNLEHQMKVLKETQEELIESQKLARLGKLVAGVTHEMNTPIGLAVTSSSILQKESGNLMKKFRNGEMTETDFTEFLEKTKEIASILMTHMTRANDIIASFKTISIDEVSERKSTIRPDEYFRIILKSLATEMNNSEITIQMNIDETLECTLEAGVLSQILSNFVQNSIKHGKREGEPLIITIDFSEHGERFRFTYRDNGKGMTKELKEHAFEPFVTENPTTGSGIGLFVVQQLVREKLKGTIRLESSLGNGSLFEIEFNK